MATTKEFLNYVLEQLSPINGLTVKRMMGEYIIYINGKITAYVCDNRLLLKPVKCAEKFIDDIIYQPPYNGAKDMILIENIDDGERLVSLFLSAYKELPEPKPKKIKTK